MNKFKNLEGYVYNTPLKLLEIKDKTFLEELGFYYLPYSIGLEIECDDQPNSDIRNCLKAIPFMKSVVTDSHEKRFRIPYGINGLICLYLASTQLKSNCLTTDSGIHYHVDMTSYYELINKEFLEDNSSWILEELDSWNYGGNYNRRRVDFSGFTWCRFQSGFKTMEVRIGEMTFDYSLMLKRISSCCKIATKIKEMLSGTYEHISGKVVTLEQVNKYYSQYPLLYRNVEEEKELIKLKKFLDKMKEEGNDEDQLNSETIPNNVNDIVKKRIIRI